MKNIFIIFIVLFAAGCGEVEYVRFESPQPENVSSKKSFQKNIRATYLNCSNSNDQLIITERLILNTQTLTSKFHRNDIEFDSTIIIDKQNNTQLMELLEKEGWSITIIGDTIYSTIQSTDTLFQITNEQILKKFKGSYFLNYRFGESYWHVKRMDLTNDSLFIGEITPSDTLLRFDFVNKNEEFDKVDSSRTVEYFIKPTKKEFKRLLSPNSFEETKCYIKKK